MADPRNERRVEMPEGMDAELQLEWLANWISSETGHEAPSCVPQKGLREGESAVESIIRMVLERNDEIDRLKGVVCRLECEAETVFREAVQGHRVAPCPVIRCPVCGAPDVDMDGFGCIACPRDPTICYCSHPSVTDGVCGICENPESRFESQESAPPDPWERHCKGSELRPGDRIRMPDKLTWNTVEDVLPDDIRPKDALFVTFVEPGFSIIGIHDDVVVRRAHHRG